MSHPALQQVRELSNTFAQTYPELDRRNAFPHEEIRHLKESGLLGFSIPKEYGGMGASCQDITAAIVILAEGNPAIAQMFLVHCLLGASFIDDFAPESLKQYVFQEILEHHAFLGNAASEKHSKVMYAFEMSFMPTPDNTGVRINGTKFFSTGSMAGDLIAVIGMLDNNMALAIVPRNAPGLTIHEDWHALGQRGTGSGTTEFRDVFAPWERVVPSLVGESRQLPQTNLLGPITQIGFTAVFIGAAKAALAQALQYVRTKTRPYPWPGVQAETAVEDPYILHEVGSMGSHLAAAETLTYKAAQMLDEALAVRGKVGEEEMKRLRAEASVAVSQAKVVATDVALHICQNVFRICGARAALAEENLDRFWRDVRTLTLHDPIDYRIRSVGEYLLQGKSPTPALRY